MFPVAQGSSRHRVAGNCAAGLLTIIDGSRVHAYVTPKYRPGTSSALILAADPMAGALMAAAVELTGIPPVFALAGEHGKAALLRCRPRYILLSHDEPCARDDSVLGPALMTGARIFIFGTHDQVTPLRPLLARHNVETIILPLEVDALRALLRAERESSRHQPPTTAP
jgi:hypothetical protein